MKLRARVQALFRKCYRFVTNHFFRVELFSKNRYIIAEIFLFIKCSPNMDTKIINQWIEGCSDIALKKLMNNEPLTFEDNIIFALIGQREEIRRIEQKIEDVKDEMTDIKLEIRDMRADIKEFRRTNDDLRKELITQTRWIITAIVAVPVLLKLIDALLGK
ncbi:MAG: hypothetical protein EAZ92_03625 [Candidatus Kapaibacterium sp.]|nr:MAG: hypothetical protein EAZ92_03625 [Candidatus Kapabacteria bacterium]